jgi:alkylation response protein AidB-like acyl-CoA dehydrogenase
MCTGGARGTVGEAARYALGRKQFGEPIAKFGAVRQKLADMTLRLYASESALYRTTGLIDAKIGGSHEGAAVLAALEEFALEASLLKVLSSEMVDFVVDENVQIHGGNGFVADYPAERRYRDARVNRIFEGTNEINRLLMPGILIKRGLKGGLPLVATAKALRDELMSVAPPEAALSGGALEAEQKIVAALRKTVIVAVGLSMGRFGEKLQDEQEVLMALSDLMIEAFAAESCVLRARQAAAAGGAMVSLHADAAMVIAHDAGLRAETVARTLVGSILEGDGQRTALAGLRRVLKVAPANTIAARRRIAEAVLSKRAYPYSE